MIERISCSDTAMMTKPSEHGAMAKLMVAAARIRGMSTSAAPASARSEFDVDVNMISPRLVKVKLATCLHGNTPHLAVVVDESRTATWVGGAGQSVRFSSVSSVKTLADQLLALLPERLRALRIQCVRLHAPT